MVGNPGDNVGFSVSAIVVSYNSGDRIVGAIRSHDAALRAFNGEIIVVDNASSDDSVSAVRSANVERCTVIANRDNIGYGKAVNQALRVARGDAALILNDDARISADSLEALVAALVEDDRVAMVGPRIVDEGGMSMPSARSVFPGLSEEVQRLRDLVRGVNRNALYPTPSSEPTDVAWLVGACLLVRTHLMKRLGGFNPAFFLYAEDIDLSRRLHEYGYRVRTVPNARCIHSGSVSTSVEFGADASSKRRTSARDLYYRIWLSRPERALVHLRRALGLSNQPRRVLHHLPRVIWDGASLHHLRFPPRIP